MIKQCIGSKIQNLTFDENTLDAALGDISAPIDKKDEARITISNEIHSIEHSQDISK